MREPGILMQLVLFALLVGSGFLPAGVITALMLLMVAFLVADPYGGDTSLRFPGWYLFMLILVAGIAGSGGKPLHDVGKDVWYVGNVALTLFLGFLAAGRCVALLPVLRVFSLAAIAVSAVHIARFAANPAWLHAPLLEIRAEAGAGHLLSAIGIGIVIAGFRYGLHPFGYRSASLFTAVICLISIVLSFSRTLWICLATFMIVVILIDHFATACRWLVVGGAIVAATMITHGTFENRDHSAPETFTEKMANIFQELRLAEYADVEEINRNWRGFESYQALTAYADGDSSAHLLGHGFGTRVDLGFTMILADQEFDSIPVLHNGYLYLLLKTGAVGLLACLSYFFMVLVTGMTMGRQSPENMRASGFLLVSLAVIMVESTLVISGMFNKNWMYPGTLLIGILMGQGRQPSITPVHPMAGLVPSTGLRPHPAVNDPTEQHVG